MGFSLGKHCPEQYSELTKVGDVEASAYGRYLTKYGLKHKYSFSDYAEYKYSNLDKSANITHSFESFDLDIL